MKKKLISILALGIVAGAYCHAEDSGTIDSVAVWTKNCKKCHGSDGSPTKVGKKFGARDYKDAAVQASFTDEEAIKVTKEGVFEDGKKKMPPYADKLSDEEIAAVVKLVRSFAK